MAKRNQAAKKTATKKATPAKITEVAKTQETPKAPATDVAPEKEITDAPETGKAPEKEIAEGEFPIVITQEDLENNPDLKEEGVKAGDVVTVPAKVLEEFTEEEMKVHDLMAPYMETYPEQKAFLVATDGQVFLEANRQDALTHQKTLNPKKELYTYNVL